MRQHTPINNYLIPPYATDTLEVTKITKGHSDTMPTLLIKSFLLATLLALNTSALASITIGELIPEVVIKDKGELLLQGDTIAYQNWNSQTLTGKVHTLQYMAGRSSASKINDPFMDQLKTLELSIEQHQVTTIVNLDDAMFGTSGFVASELKKNKQRYPASSIIADADGRGAEQWQLEQKSSAIFVLSTEGKVLFFKQGALSEQEIDQAISLIKEQVLLLSPASLSVAD